MLVKVIGLFGSLSSDYRKSLIDSSYLPMFLRQHPLLWKKTAFIESKLMALEKLLNASSYSSILSFIIPRALKAGEKFESS